MNQHLVSMYRQLNISGDVGNTLREVHGIVNYVTLSAKRAELEGKALDQVSHEVQQVLATTIAYLTSLKLPTESNPLKQFKKVDWENFCLKHRSDPNSEKQFIEATDSDVEIEDDDPDSDMKMPTQRKKKVPDKNEPVKQVGPQAPRLLGKFEIIDQSFEPKDGMPQLECEFRSSAARQKECQLTHVTLPNGWRFDKGHCYKGKSEKNEEITLGIRSFKSETEANCVLVLPISKTFLGSGIMVQEFIDVANEKNPSGKVQCGHLEVVPLLDLGDPTHELLPKIIYEPRIPGGMQSFAYRWDTDRNSPQVVLPRQKMRLIDAFSGAGGTHLGFHREGFETAMAIEKDEAAVKTFMHNNPGVPVWPGDIREFIEKMRSNEEYRLSLGRIHAVHCSSPCQGFSGLNTSGGRNDKDNNELSYTFVELLEVTGALVGSFENVTGMWSGEGMPYLRKLLIGCIKLGYQVRVTVLRASDYGDPQERLRLIIMVAKNYVPLPRRPICTHGPVTRPDLTPYVTVDQALEVLGSPMATIMNFPNMGDGSTSDCKAATKDETVVKDFIQLERGSLAPTLVASNGNIFHYSALGPDGNLRNLNVREFAALQSFPYNYEFIGTQTEKFKQVGNAVPVNFAAAIAASLRASIINMFLPELMEEYGDGLAVHENNDDMDVDDGEA